MLARSAGFSAWLDLGHSPISPFIRRNPQSNHVESVWRPTTQTMLQKIMLLCLLTYTISCCGCKRRPPKDPIAELSGKWSMVFGSSCKNYGLKSDTLVLHSDGTFDQFTVAQDGRRFEATDQHWKFSAPNSIELDQRRNFFTTQRYQTLVGVPEFESIIVEFTSPPTIVFNPDSDCFYTKTERGNDKSGTSPK